MKDESKTKAQLFKAPEEQRQRNAELEKQEMEPKRAQEALRRSEERFRLLFEESPSGIALLDTKGVILEANKSLLKLLDMKKEEMIGKSFIELAPAFGLNCREQLMDFTERLTGGNPNNELTFRNRGGEQATIAVKSLAVMTDGKASGVLYMVEDITARKRAEEEREQMLLWQQGVGGLLQSLLAPASLEDKLKMITDGILNIFGADFCRIWLIRPGDLCEQGCSHAEVHEGPHACLLRDRCLHLLASSGRYTHIDGRGHSRVPFGCYKIGRVASGEDHKFLTNDAQNEPHVHNHEWARELGLVSFAGYQLRVPGGEKLGVLALFAKHPILPAEDAMLDGLSSTVALVIRQAVTEKALKESEERYRVLFEGSADGILIADIKTRRFKYANKALCEMLGYSLDEISGLSVIDIHPKEDLDWIIREFEAQARGEKTLTQNIPCLRKDGTVVYADINTTKISIGGRDCNVGFFRNMTEQRRAQQEKEKLEEQLRVSQKLEVVGQLAGGIAHEFNNILGGITGYADTMKYKIEPDSKLAPYVKKILNSAFKASDLAGQLLTFARRSQVEMEPCDIHHSIAQTIKFLKQTIDKRIQIQDCLLAKESTVIADQNQIETSFLKISINARDAMPDGGILTLKTENVTLNEQSSAGMSSDLLPGEYIKISISDNGAGMDEEVKKKIFEPFFTTKGVGKGTGLGLAGVYGTVKQHKGHIEVETELNRGSTFIIYLPLSVKPPGGEKSHSYPAITEGT